MKNKGLFYLFLVNFAIFFTGMGLTPVLPLYATRFGATPAVVGLYMAFIYTSIAAGSLLAGWLAGRLTRRRAFLGAGVLGIPALVLLGQATALWQVVILTGVVWFAGGVGTATVSVLTGLVADKGSRGKSFGLMTLALPLAGVFGGLTVGQLVTWQGYPLMFAALAAVWAAWPLAGLVALEDKPAPAAARIAAATGGDSRQLGPVFHLLLLAVFFSAATNQIGRLGTSLSMQSLALSPGAIASTATVGGLVAIPVTFWMGSLSDRIGRKGILMLAYILAAAGAMILSNATQLWHFWLATVLLLLVRSANGTAAAALATDMLASEALSRGLPRLNSMAYIAGIVGSAGAGYVMEALGGTTLYLIAAALAVVAAALLGLLPGQGQTLSLPRLSWRRKSLVAASTSGCTG